MRPGARMFLLLVVLALLAGCTRGGDSPAERTFSASGGKASLGWAYDGATVQPASATLDGTIVDADNTGNATATFQLANSTWTIVFDRFAQGEGRDFQDGGVAFDLNEHGDTGVADASIPRIHALVAAWGTAAVMRDGALAAPEPWTAHLMISGDTVRAADGKITKADGTTPYDPASPADARRIEGDPQAFLFVKHPQGETFAREPVVQTPSPITCTGPECLQTAEVVVESGASLVTINVTFTGSEASLPVVAGQGTVRLLDAEGTELDAQPFQVTPAGAGTVLTFSIPSAPVGAITVEVAGGGAYTATIDAIVEYDDLPFIVLTWDEVTVN